MFRLHTTLDPGRHQLTSTGLRHEGFKLRPTAPIEGRDDIEHPLKMVDNIGKCLSLDDCSPQIESERCLLYTSPSPRDS